MLYFNTNVGATLFLRYAEKNFVAAPLEMIEDESGTPAGTQEMNK